MYLHTQMNIFVQRQMQRFHNFFVVLLTCFMIYIQLELITIEIFATWETLVSQSLLNYMILRKILENR